MPKRKLDVTAAFAALSRNAALPKDELVIIEPEVPKGNRGKFNYGTSPRQVSPKMVEVHLHNTHSIGLHTYGPGLCMVEPEIAATLLHQEQVAKAVDERTMDSTTRYYQIMPMRSPVGMVYRGIPVGDLSMQGMLNRVDADSLIF